MINLEWVSDYIDIEEEDLKELAVKITKAGINIEKVISNNIDNLVIGKIIECYDHPNSDHLHVCRVDIGSEVLQIVCGAKNARVGIKVIVALNGAKLPGGTIKKSKIRDIESNGMLCSLSELGFSDTTDGIYEVASDAKLGVNALSYLNLSSTLYELDIHKHRNNDCYYHIGFAYEIAAILNKKVKLPKNDYEEIEDNINNYLKLEVDTNKCSYYLAKMVSNVKIKESPEFIKKRLESIGIRSINNVVDISNYVMLEYGQPLHFFDKEKLGSKILVRDAKEKEGIITLDDKNRILNSNDIVVCDDSKALCIAGVMGASNSMVDNDTKNIVIESAIFDPISIRNTASKLNLKTDASIRFGKGLSYEYTNMALDRACYLLEKYADAKILSGILIHDKVDKSKKYVEFNENDINKMLGIEVSIKDIEYQLNRLDFPYTIKDNKFVVQIPKRRLDIDPNINDIAEEIGRLYGYHNLVSTLPNTNIKKGEYKKDVGYRKIISKRLRSLGLNEAKTYTLVSSKMASMFKYEDNENISLPNPMSLDKAVIRTTIIPSLLSVYEYNKARKVDNICIYEIAKTYNKELEEDSKITVLMSGNYISNSWQNNNVKIDFYLIKGILENLLDYLGLSNRYTFIKDNIDGLHPGICASILLDNKKIGIIGRIHPNIIKDDVYIFEISMNSLITNTKPLKYKEVSKYPTITKDVAFILENNITSKEIIDTIRKTGGRNLVNISVFDVYKMDNKKSLGFSLEFNDKTRTLRDLEINEIFNKIINEVIKKHNAILRDK